MVSIRFEFLNALVLLGRKKRIALQNVKDDTKMGPKDFLRHCALVTGVVSVAIALFNLVMDPYLIFGMPREAGLNARKPAVESQLFLMKAYDVLRANPRTLILGSSSVGIGLDPTSPAWPSEMQPVYNLAVPNGTPLESLRYLQHVTAHDHPNVVILGLEFRDFLPWSGFKKPEYDSWLLVRSDGSGNEDLIHQHIGDLLLATLSLDASVDSLYALSVNLLGDSSDIFQGGWDFRPFRHMTSEVGSYPLFALSDFVYAFASPSLKLDMSPLDDVRSILNICREERIKLILILDPGHVDEEEIFDLAGKWLALEEWKRELTALVATYANTDVATELWDFYGYDAYSTESVPNSRRALHWFLNPAHYTHPLGDIILRRVLDGSTVPFGVKLTPQNIETRLQEVRTARTRYRALQSQDVARVRKLYALATAPRPG